MRMKILITLFAVPATLALLPTAAWAGASFDRPDLVDVPGVSFVDSKNTATSIYATINAGQSSGSWNTAYGNASATADNGVTYEFAEVFWRLYEPEKVIRTGNLVLLNQNKHLFVGVYTSTATVATDNVFSDYTSGVAPCSALVRAKAASPGGENADIAWAKWKASCRGALAAMALPQSVTDRLTALLNKRIVNVATDNIAINGYCRESAGCVNPD
ncbi:MAG: hypothetical protein OEM05_03685 [Myxococcales bacterium]|nr:hypothetical protein [Myxococcales bacterium]